MAIAHGSARCTPAFHCHCAGTFASYWKVTSCGTGRRLRPWPSVCSMPLRRSAESAIGGLPGIENTVLPSGRS